MACLCGPFGKDKTNIELIPIAKEILEKEEIPEVRFAFLNRIDKLLLSIDAM